MICLVNSISTRLLLSIMMIGELYFVTLEHICGFSWADWGFKKFLQQFEFKLRLVHQILWHHKLEQWRARGDLQSNANHLLQKLFLLKQFYGKIYLSIQRRLQLESNPEFLSRCDEVMQEQIERTSLRCDLYGFTEASQTRLYYCIEENKNCNIERVLPEVVRFIDVSFMMFNEL